MRLFAGTEFDRPPRCERCDQLESECRCPPPEPVRIPPGKQTARISIESRKNGKRVTVVRGLSSGGNDLPALLKRLKTVCGAGGMLDGDLLEIQGEQIERVQSVLRAVGYQVK